MRKNRQSGQILLITLLVLSIATIHVLIFRWILNRMPVLRKHPDYHDAH